MKKHSFQTSSQVALKTPFALIKPKYSCTLMLHRPAAILLERCIWQHKIGKSPSNVASNAIANNPWEKRIKLQTVVAKLFKKRPIQLIAV